MELGILSFVDLSVEEIEEIKSKDSKLKACVYCKKEYPNNIAYFAKHMRYRDGFDTRCRECKAEQDAGSKRRKKEKFATHGNAVFCELCECEFTENGEEAQVDHSHITGEIRGYLCKSCNMQIGKLGDEKEDIMLNVEKMLAYLDSYDTYNSEEFLNTIKRLYEYFLLGQRPEAMCGMDGGQTCSENDIGDCTATVNCSSCD